MPSTTSRISIFTALITLLVFSILLIIIVTNRSSPEIKLGTPLTALLPDKIPGWVIEDKPIADTEEMKKAVGEALNYDDGIFRHYSSGNTIISVYAAYWRPGKMQSRLIAAHTPDVCWIGGGWKCTSRDYQKLLSYKDQKLPPAQWGVYEHSGVKQNVVFWHLQSGRLVAYNTGGIPPWWAALSDMWKYGLDQRGEQFFIRISSNIPIENFWDLEPTQKIIQNLIPFLLANESKI